MAKVRLRGQQNDGTGEATEDREVGGSIALKPLSIAGVVITRKTLVEALRIYAPQLEDIEVFEDGERFFLTLRPVSDG
ncbi:MAG: hypothetical protein HY331_16200 [Chloroflexi bacterium]|nr:hypothetical protein [Chloroflexota bacterium]